ncbi:hypothetical protein GTY87_00200 [Streptomyces sp. SID7813]|uniref:Uncharacterized protein n=1 Tax=Streptomyces coelicolor (strain ATCC BAA-471 / A3(2) / M145) TaxID=100226 RepID=Q9S1U7_STRCO|nr:hypothetical protein [Streptomyces sp. SID7813]QFI40378.1 hypothetical protein FQ762_00210 [Streptomyces coelicolor A3(2)]CAB52960.1 hypothetical protein [Streptomyces coelicolor A3(2)]
MGFSRQRYGARKRPGAGQAQHLVIHEMVANDTVTIATMILSD